MSETKSPLQKIKDFILNVSDEEKVELSTEEVKEEPKTEEVKLEMMTLEDGNTQIEAEKFEEGEAVFIVNEEERIALPIGEYKLSDGQMLLVEEEGIIKSLGEAQEEEEEMSTDNPELNELKEQIKALLSKTESNETKLEEVTKERDALQAKLDEIPDAELIVNAPVALEHSEPKTIKEKILFKIRQND